MKLDDVSKVGLSLVFRFYITIILYMYFSLCFCSSLLSYFDFELNKIL